MLTEVYPRRIVGHYIEFLEKVEQWIPSHVERIYAVLDNLSMHSANDVLLFNLAYPRWEFVFQPKYARLPAIPASQGLRSFPPGTGPDSPSGDHLWLSQSDRALVEGASRSGPRWSSPFEERPPTGTGTSIPMSGAGEDATAPHVGTALPPRPK